MRVGDDLNRSGSRIAFLSFMLPKVTQTFSAGELRAWRAKGLDIEAISFKAPLPGSPAADAGPVTYLPHISARHWLAGWLRALRKPLATVRCFIKVALTPHPRVDSPLRRAAAIRNSLRAIPLLSYLSPRRFRHVYADFAD